MGIAGLGDRALGAFRAAGVLGGPQADERHRARRGWESSRVAELGGNRERRQIVDAPEATESLNPLVQRLEREQRTKIVLHVTQAALDLIDGAEVRTMRLIEGGERPCLRPQPGVVPSRPCLLRPGEAATVAQQKLRQPVACAQQIGANVCAAGSHPFAVRYGVAR